MTVLLCPLLQWHQNTYCLSFCLFLILIIVLRLLLSLGLLSLHCVIFPSAVLQIIDLISPHFGNVPCFIQLISRSLMVFLLLFFFHFSAGLLSFYYSHIFISWKASAFLIFLCACLYIQFIVFLLYRIFMFNVIQFNRYLSLILRTYLSLSIRNFYI